MGPLHLHADHVSRLLHPVILAGRSHHDDPLDLESLQVLVAECKEAVDLLEGQQRCLLEYLDLPGQ